ncbi:RNA methyltransferase [Methylotuvimicrobium alcaliphilum]|uniref:tRNA (cytidine/uridine-2'-O-)-methyltransferase TrmJ n=1 Tax=Methylotuvimicrobium alcaliphilum (strain DSM 19304 / NCIMB 14124 / VKM B-2133 / 20Z) TaxID=1091494 RepID=G4SZK3_META2|nr:RNA methyltransferase [Methylotuvimicrobium alcaliphilum]CCE24444.1 Putative tRNA/rRNA methyltransferase [Methylotuvimicrobium alcaliphilum 20Z]
MLSNIKIVLVETSHPGNIGAVARAMKNMNLKNLVLVTPKQFPCADATARASGADDILSSALVCDSLQEAVADCSIVVGTSARCRTISWPELTPRECADLLKTEAVEHNAAIVFGREHSGLKNHELDLCRYLLRIPCNKDFSSLNLAAAVQVVSYELFVASGQDYEVTAGDKGKGLLATAAQMEAFYEHMIEALTDTGFMHPDKSKSVMRRLRRIYNRARLESKEVDLLRGILRMSQGNKKKG